MTALKRPAIVPPPHAVRRVTMENEHVLVTETTYPAGGSVPLHTHRFPHVLYVIEGRTVETTSSDGLVQTLALQPGETHWRRPQSHSTRNIGSTPVRIVEVELKDTLSRYVREHGPLAIAPASLDWIADTLDPTRTMALMAGDPAKTGPYTVRFRAQPGYKIATHIHPNEDECLTVMSGTLHWSSGDAGSGALEHELPAGGFVLFPAGTAHRLWVDEETVLQMTGIGPREYVYPNP